MRISIRNSADIPKKYLRLAKWKVRKIADKFSDLIYAEIFITKEGKTFAEYSCTIRLGVKGDDIVLKNSSNYLPELWSSSLDKVDRYLRKHKEKFQRRQFQTR